MKLSDLHTPLQVPSSNSLVRVGGQEDELTEAR